MAVTTIMAEKENKLSKFLIYFLGIVGVGLVVFFGGQLIQYILNRGGKAGLSVETLNSSASILVDGAKIGESPFTSNAIKPGSRTVTIKNDIRQYQATFNFIPSDNGIIHMVGIKRDLGVSDSFSSGQEFWFEKDNTGNTIRIISEPTGATVYIDGSEVGKTPFSSTSVTPGSYTLVISAQNYESQETQIKIQKGYTLNGNIKLFPYPMPSTVKLMQDSQILYDLSLDNPVATADTQSWAKAVVYWNTTRGATLSGAAGTKEKVFDFFLDYKGNIFDKDGSPVSSAEELNKLGEIKKGGYLGRTADGAGLTAEAKSAFATISGTAVMSAKTATIGATPNGWLRVRDAGSLTGNEIAKVNTGEKYPVLETTKDWVKIKVSETVSGWVSAGYVTVTE